jgi:hypothetical protein
MSEALRLAVGRERRKELALNLVRPEQSQSAGMRI